jgi:hypothetical protein
MCKRCHFMGFRSGELDEHLGMIIDGNAGIATGPAPGPVRTLTISR